jgi:uncharacterized OB-fold protein
MTYARITEHEDLLIERAAPDDDPLAHFFWTSGADGRLRILRCQECSYYIHPPTSRCPQCQSASVEPEVVSGKGSVHTYTVNEQEWIAGQAPFVIAIVNLEEQDDLRLTTNLLDVTPADAAIGMRVEVAFLHRNDVWYPLFSPEGSIE